MNDSSKRISSFSKFSKKWQKVTKKLTSVAKEGIAVITFFSDKPPQYSYKIWYQLKAHQRKKARQPTRFNFEEKQVKRYVLFPRKWTEPNLEPVLNENAELEKQFNCTSVSSLMYDDDDDDDTPPDVVNWLDSKEYNHPSFQIVSLVNTPTSPNSDFFSNPVNSQEAAEKLMLIRCTQRLPVSRLKFVSSDRAVAPQPSPCSSSPNDPVFSGVNVYELHTAVDLLNQRLLPPLEIRKTFL